jgi:hypothetical protein
MGQPAVKYRSDSVAVTVAAEIAVNLWQPDAGGGGQVTLFDEVLQASGSPLSPSHSTGFDITARFRHHEVVQPRLFAGPGEVF